MKFLPNYLSDCTGYIEARDSLLRHRFLISKELLLASIRKNDLQINTWAAPDADIKETINNNLVNVWKDTNWGESLEYYLWSRRHIFSDSQLNNDKRLQVQKDMLESYIVESNDIPLPRTANLNQAMILQHQFQETNFEIGKSLELRSCSTPKSQGYLSLEDLSYILYYGLRDIVKFRYPSEDNLKHDLLFSFGRSFEFFVVVYKVDGITPGVHYYDPCSHAVELIEEGDLREEMVDILIGHSAPRLASCSILIVQNHKIFQWQYRHERSLRNSYYECGRIMQRLLLAATARNANTHITPACIDSKAERLLKLIQGEQQLYYILTI